MNQINVNPNRDPVVVDDSSGDRSTAAKLTPTTRHLRC